MKSAIRSFILTAFLTIGTFVSYAQFGTPPPPPDDEDIVPVDGGVGILLAAGAAWGIKKLADKKEE